MRAVIDSDVLIDYLQGIENAKVEIDRYARREISIISWMEIMARADSPQEENECRAFLSTFTIHQLSVEIAGEAVRLRKKFRVRLPDAIVWATARVNDCLLVTRNTKDFSTDEPGVRVPYSV
ncbi:MAG: type II toxin-antitoxin system VapC family toxin [Verrucomicrobiota bacterium]